ncbi:hypothetical protein KIN20_004164 [Parelaphostrongylus tenuis]|uniref:Uncharacterized protein n=1 Tax=Parelaphostrongylus tenuis TaxID=148309 RepID=A0AAD5MGU4_PARTN|nr:hypothetical protein KIN20_004164 [Parelaphostrongylus tenuis]
MGECPKAHGNKPSEGGLNLHSSEIYISPRKGGLPKAVFWDLRSFIRKDKIHKTRSNDNPLHYHVVQHLQAEAQQQLGTELDFGDMYYGDPVIIRLTLYKYEDDSKPM